MKWDKIIDNIAGDVKTFVDDLRYLGTDEERAWEIARRIASIFQHLGIQDAPRKRKPPIRGTGAWAWSMFSTILGKIQRFVSQKKWNKARTWIRRFLIQLAEEPAVELDYKELEQATGFLCHLLMTYKDLAPYLKGFYLSLHKHLPRRDADGWKLSEKHWEAYIYAKLEKAEITEEEADQMLHPPSFEDIDRPTTLGCAPELLQALPARDQFFSQESPPKMLVRSETLLYIQCGFVDASGTGLGPSITTDQGIRVRIGTWGKDSEDDSSNWREFENLVTTLESEVASGNLNGAAVVICTDNFTVEAAANKASSTSPKLYRLAVRLKALQFRCGAQFTIPHVAGERMKDQGTDGSPAPKDKPPSILFASLHCSPTNGRNDCGRPATSFFRLPESPCSGPMTASNL
jgi:hypothetical protein